jgi:hypothetical protein
MAAVATRSLRVFPRVVRGLDSFDQALFARLPFLRKYAWIVVLSLRRPLMPTAVAADEVVAVTAS